MGDFPKNEEGNTGENKRDQKVDAYKTLKYIYSAPTEAGGSKEMSSILVDE
jgi:hypothetical protein